MAGGFRGTWPGGRIYWKDLGDEPQQSGGNAGGKAGRASAKTATSSTASQQVLTGRERGRTYYIWKSVGGRKYQISTRCSLERSAIKELERFEADPENYKPGGEKPEPSASPIYLTASGGELDPTYLMDAYLQWCRDIRGNSKGWLWKQKSYLTWWVEKLEGIDLRKASLRDHVEPALGPEHLQPSTRAKRIAVLKGLYSYMRTERHAREHGFGISVSEDPVFGTLRVPQSDPKKRKLKDKAVPMEHVLLAIEHLTGHWRHALELQAGTGWHVTEVARFASGGRIEPYPRRGPDQDIAGVLVCPETKIGGELRTGVSAKVLEAAKALLGHRARGNKDEESATFSIQKYGFAVKAACRAAKIPPFTPGRMRHSVATHAVNAGADLQSLSTFLNHKSPATTRKFYATHGVAKRPPTML
jgi:integrase